MTLSREQWRTWLPYAPAAVITVIVIIVALALEGPTNATPQNQARPPEGDQVSAKTTAQMAPVHNGGGDHPRDLDRARVSSRAGGERARRFGT